MKCTRCNKLLSIAPWHTVSVAGLTEVAFGTFCHNCWLDLIPRAINRELMSYLAHHLLADNVTYSPQPLPLEEGL
jgi:hypothetical protein